MLSHTASPKHPTQKLNKRKPHGTTGFKLRDWLRSESLPFLGENIKRFGHFLKICYVDGMKALVAGRYDTRQACIIIAATVPVLLGVMVLFVPLALFPTPEHRAFYHFADTLANDSISMLPVVLGAVSTTLGLKVPVV